MAEPSDYKKTLNLPQTTFAMKANLPLNEPKRLEQWREIDLYRLIREKSEGRPKFVLHDGPPYANGRCECGRSRTEVRRAGRTSDGLPTSRGSAIEIDLPPLLEPLRLVQRQVGLHCEGRLREVQGLLVVTRFSMVTGETSIRV